LDADWTMAATRNTEAALKRIGVSKLEVLHQSGIGNGDEVEHFWRERTPVTKSAEGILKIVTACRLVHWKAVDLAIEAVDRARKAGIPVELEILSDGPEASSLKRLVRKLDLEKVVVFRGRLPKIEDVFEQVSHADALIHPALHEAFGQSCLEAMALGTPVICLDWAGPGLIVDKKTGYAVKPEGREKTIKNLADAINRCYQDKREGTSKGDAAASRARKVFSWSGLADRINLIYMRVVNE
jgi:glycosyltransferase involved in cell wall biosynthesis